MNTCTESMHEELWNGFHSTRVACCPVLTVGGSSMSITLLLGGRDVSPFLEEIFADTTLPCGMRGLGGQPCHVVNLLRDNLLKHVVGKGIFTEGLPALLAKYAFACHCLSQDQWGGDGPSISFLTFRSLLLAEYEIIKENRDFANIVMRFRSASPLTEPSDAVLMAYFRGSFKTCETVEQIKDCVNGLVLLIWVIVLAKNVQPPSPVTVAMIRFFRRTPVVS